jgi:predicted PhzF superfamily epimerase YddE/YHI9
MNLPLYWVDAFADRVFAGNPAAVVPLAGWIPDPLMQQIAFENGLAETAFFVRTAEARFHLRWFTPAVEVDLCGHATLASAYVLFNEIGERADVVTFDSRSGPLAVKRREDGKLELDFPATPVAEERDRGVEQAIIAALDRAPEWLGRSRFDRFAVFPDAGFVRTLRPNLHQVAAAGGRGLIVTAPGDDDCDFVSRFFAPQSGVPEDPVTGSAHCALAPYWAHRIGKTSLRARQVSARGGELACHVVGGGRDGGEMRVRIAGAATLYLRGEIQV